MASARQPSRASDFKLRHCRQLQVADALGLGLKWYFAEKFAADYVREKFSKDEELHKIIIAHMPPRKHK
jgi:hypothetical protein